jgi:hypothetical protein
MNAGDFMYFPAGMCHSVETIEPGVSINVSLMGTTYAEVYCQALQHALLKDDGWRSVVNVGADGPGKLEELMRTKLFSVAKELSAGCILPPVQLEKRSPKFGVEDEEEESDDENDDEEEQHGVIHLDREFSHGDAPGMDKAFADVSPSTEFKVNPLCVLINADEMTYFDELDGKKRGREDDDGVERYVANINFAGSSSEAMVSAERHVILAESNSPEHALMMRILSSPTEGPGHRIQYDKSARVALQWLFYCGVLVR